MKKILIIQTSLNKKSKTSITADKTLEIGKKLNIEIELLDLRKYDFQMCNGSKIEEYNGDMNEIKNIIEGYEYYILAYPIYNYSFSGVCKNFIDIYSHYMDSKKCGIIQNSYSTRSFSDGYSELAKILGLHNNIQLTLPMVHTANEDFENNELIGTKAIEKIEKMILNLIK